MNEFGVAMAGHLDGETNAQKRLVVDALFDEMGLSESCLDDDSVASSQSISPRSDALLCSKRLNASEVKWLLWEGMPLLDARTAAEYLRCQIQGALQVGVRPSRHQLHRLGLEISEPLVCYSNGEHRARQLVAHLTELGFRCVYLLEAGLEGFLPLQDA